VIVTPELRPDLDEALVVVEWNGGFLVVSVRVHP
jgi:hypothetical protein